MTGVHRVFNFAAGPAVLPLPVLEEIQRDMLALPAAGMSILEISHRSAPFESILAQAEADIRTLGHVPSTQVLFLRGAPACGFHGADEPADAGRHRHYRLRLVGRKAIRKRRVGNVNVAATTRARTTRVCHCNQATLTPAQRSCT
jgi:phosphoserine aminotransferase